MELRHYLRVLRRRWITVAVFTMLGILGAAGISQLMEPTYTAKTQLFVSIKNSGTVAELQQAHAFTQERVESYVKTATTPVVLQPAIEELDLDTTPEELQRSITASADLNTVLITITASTGSPESAAAIAQSVGDSLVEVIEDLESPSPGVSSPIRLSVVTPAVEPGFPASPNIRLNMVLGFLLGFALGVGVAIMRTTMDTRIRAEADLRRVTQAPVLGGIVADTSSVKRPLLKDIPVQSPRAEAFRQLRTNLQFARVSRHSKTLMVTSTLAGEGKSTTAVNLAITMAQAGQSVVLVDADLRRPRIDEYLGLERRAGLTTALIGRAETAALLQPWGTDGIQVLTSGQIPPNPSELLGSSSAKQLFHELEQDFDVVIVDAPPLLPVTDAVVLSQQVGGVVLVVGASKVRLPELQKALGSLEMVSADLLGIVLNHLPSKGPDAPGYFEYSYDSFSLPQEETERDGANSLSFVPTPAKREPADEMPSLELKRGLDLSQQKL